MFDNSILVELQDVGDISVDIGDVKTVVVPEKKVPQAIPRITVDENGLITATSNQESGSVDGGIEKSTYQLAVEQGKTIHPSSSRQLVFPKNTYSLGDVIVDGVSSEEKEINVTDDGNYEISPSYGKLLSKAFVNVDTSQKRKEAFEAGKKAGQDAIWDLILGNGERTDFGYFCKGWFAEYIRPPQKIVPTTNNSRLLTFSGCRFLKRIEKEYFDFSQCPKGANTQQSYYYTFSDCPELEVIEDVGINNAYSLSSTFSNDRKLHTIECIYPDADTLYQNTFANCNSLVYLRVNGTIGENGFNTRWSTKLSKESHISIVNALSTTTSGLTVTLSKTAVNKAFETASGANDGSTSTEWLTLIGTRPNVTISLA